MKTEIRRKYEEKIKSYEDEVRQLIREEKPNCYLNAFYVFDKIRDIKKRMNRVY